MVKVCVNGGICGFQTEISIDGNGDKLTEVKFVTQCPNLKPLETELTVLDGFRECFSSLDETDTYTISKPYVRHPGCPVPSAIIKGIEVACGFALPKDPEITIRKD